MKGDAGAGRFVLLLAYHQANTNHQHSPANQDIHGFGHQDPAIAGQRVMLATYPIAADCLASGLLVRPFGDDYTLMSSVTYNLLLPDSGTVLAAVQRFVDWLESEAQRFREYMT